MKLRLCTATTLCVCAAIMGSVARTAIADNAPIAAIDDLVRNLGSDEFSAREAAQQQMAKLPPESLGALRVAESRASDKEVIVRLREGIAAIELRGLLHPPTLSLDMKNATLGDVAKALNTRLGADYIAVHAGDERVTVKAQDQPLWEILRQLDQQEHLQFSYKSPNRQELTEPITTITVTSRGPNQGLGPETVFTSDGLGILPVVYTDPASGNQVLQCTICMDPRVRVVRHAMVMHVEKALDQNGRALVTVVPAHPLTASPGRAVSTFVCTATLAGGPQQVQQIRELRATVMVELLEHEEAVRFDLTKLPAKPQAMSNGRFTVVDRGDNFYWLQNLEPKPPGPGWVIDHGGAGLVTESEAGVDIVFTRTFDEHGQMMQSGFFDSSGRETRLPKEFQTGPRATTVEITAVSKSRKVVLPIVLKDLDVPAIIVPAPFVP